MTGSQHIELVKVLAKVFAVVGAGAVLPTWALLINKMLCAVVVLIEIAAIVFLVKWLVRLPILMRLGKIRSVVAVVVSLLVVALVNLSVNVVVFAFWYTVYDGT